jgi:hypothetical protein
VEEEQAAETRGATGDGNGHEDGGELFTGGESHLAESSPLHCAPPPLGDLARDDPSSLPSLPDSPYKTARLHR